MNRTQHGNISIYVIVLSILLIGVATLAITKLNQEKSNQTESDENSSQTEGEENTGPAKEINSTQENAEIEYKAVLASDAEQCTQISGESVALGEVDQIKDYPEDAAKKRCQEAATKGHFLSPRIEHLLKNHAGL